MFAARTGFSSTLVEPHPSLVSNIDPRNSACLCLTLDTRSNHPVTETSLLRPGCRVVPSRSSFVLNPPLHTDDPKNCTMFLGDPMLFADLTLFVVSVPSLPNLIIVAYPFRSWSLTVLAQTCESSTKAFPTSPRF